MMGITVEHINKLKRIAKGLEKNSPSEEEMFREAFPNVLMSFEEEHSQYKKNWKDLQKYMIKNNLHFKIEEW